MSSEPSNRTKAPRCASRPANSGQCRNIVNGPWSVPRLCTIASTVAWSFAATWFLLVIGVSLAMMSSSLVRDRPVELHLDPALGEAFLLAALAVGRQVGRLAMGVERGIVLVLLVEDEDVRILRGAVRAIDETARLRALHLRHLFLEQLGQRVALALGRTNLRHHRQHIRHHALLLSDVGKHCRLIKKGQMALFYRPAYCPTRTFLTQPPPLVVSTCTKPSCSLPMKISSSPFASVATEAACSDGCEKSLTLPIFGRKTSPSLKTAPAFGEPADSLASEPTSRCRLGL